MVLVGRQAHEATKIIRDKGAVSVQSLTVEGLGDVERLCRYLNYHSQFDLALLAAGVPVTIAVLRIAEATGRVVIDFGHALDLIIDGPELIDCQEYFEKLVRDYNDSLRKEDSGV